MSHRCWVTFRNTGSVSSVGQGTGLPSHSERSGMRTGPREGKRHVLRWVAVAAVVILAAGTLTAYLKYRAVYDSITRVNVPGSELGQRPPDYSTTSENILVYGNDSRKGLDAHEQFILHTGHDQTDNTDTIMIIHLSPGRHLVTVMSIPRDTMVPMYQCDAGPGYAGQQADPNTYVQINSLLAGRRPGLPVEDGRAADRHLHQPLHRDRHARLRQGRRRPRRRQRLCPVQRQRRGVRPHPPRRRESHRRDPGPGLLADPRGHRHRVGPGTDPAGPVHVRAGGEGGAEQRAAVEPAPAALGGHRRRRLR